MKYPTLPTQASGRETVEYFKGYNHNLRITSGEAFDMWNMTSDYFPVMSPRSERGVYATPASPQGILAKDNLCYVDGTCMVIGTERVEMGLSTKASDCPKQLISMGAYIIVMPDKKYINTLDTGDFGSIEASFVSEGEVSFEMCNLDGESYEGATIAANAPENPKNLDYWIDTSTTPHALKRYSSNSGEWTAVGTTYVKIGAEGIGEHFKQYDSVTISGIAIEQLKTLNASATIWGCGKDYIIIVGVLDAVTSQKTAVTVERRMPNLDFVIESENRLWGCRYGTAANGETVNEIYACKLGDFKNWNCFMGLSTDSYVASCGTDGPFTGAITHLGYPLFFKENCIHKVYGNYPKNYQIQTSTCRGVQKGCHNSLAIANETLYYKARGAVCAYDGSLPVEVSSALGNEAYSDATAGAVGNKYYISMKNAAGEWNLFAYDTAKKMWHKEDDLQASAFCAHHGEMYCIDRRNMNIITLFGSGSKETEPVEWMWQTGELGISSPDMKYISGITVRMMLERGSMVDFYIQYDQSEEWEHICNIRGTALRSFNVPIRPRRCDHMKLRIVGIGGGKVYSFSKTISQGSGLS